MQAGDNNYLLQGTHDEAAYSEGNVHKCLYADEQALLHNVHDGADHDQANDHAAKQRDERSNDQIQDIRHDFFQSLFNLGCDDTQHQGGQNRPLITNDWHRQCAEGQVDWLHITGSHLVGVGQLRSNQHQADDNAQCRGTAKLFHDRVGDQGW